MLATFHNHTKWSDGRSTVQEIYGYADRAGVDILGISDHFCVYPNRSSPDWSLQPSEMADYFAEVLSFRDHGNMEIRVGLEFDWFENHHEVIAPYVSRLPLDYRIGAIHHVEGKQFDVDSSYWAEKSPAEHDDVYVKYWGLVRQMAESSLFDVAAHLDLPKKLGFGPSSGVNPAVDSALDAIAAANMVVELNTAGFGKPCADGYPCLEILKGCRARDIPITLSSDGHIPEHTLYEFHRGFAQLKNAGFEKIARFRERQRWFEPLSEALTSRRPRVNA